MHPLGSVEFATLLESAPDAVVISGPEGEILFVNSQTEALFGYPRADIIGRHAEFLLPERLRGTQAMQRGAGAATRGATARGGLELFGARKDGSEFPVEISVSPITTASGVLVSASIRDVSERKRVEQEVDDLRRQQDLLLNSVTEGILALDGSGVITFANPAATKLLGYRADELVGRSEHDLLHHHRADATSYPHEMCPIHRSVADGTTHHASGEVFWTKADRPLSVDYTSAPIRERGRLVGTSVIFLDTSGRAARDAVAADSGISRTVARRILHGVVAQGSVAHQTLTQVGRQLASEVSAGTLDDHLRAYATMGLGAIAVEKEESARYTFTGADLLERRPESRVSTCAFTLGFLSEAVAHRHKGEPTLGTEIECQSRGAPRCRFIVQVKKPEDSLTRRVKELI